MKDKQVKIVALVAIGLVIIAGALYADLVYEAPEPPPKYVWTRLGQVRLYEKSDITTGDLVTSPDLGAIYYITKDFKRLVFPDEQTYLSWYKDFSNVKNIDHDELQSIPLSGKNATIRPGTLLVTIPSSNQVWMIGYPNTLFWLSGGEEQVVELFGQDWSKRLVDLPEYFFANYSEQGEISSLEASLPAGLLFYIQSEEKYYITTSGGMREVTQNGLEKNHLQTEYAITLSDLPKLNIIEQKLDDFEERFGSPDIYGQNS